MWLAKTISIRASENLSNLFALQMLNDLTALTKVLYLPAKQEVPMYGLMHEQLPSEVQNPCPLQVEEALQTKKKNSTLMSRL